MSGWAGFRHTGCVLKNSVKAYPPLYPPLIRAFLTVVASLAVAAFLAAIAFMVLAAVTGPVPPAQGEAWLVVVSLAAFIVAILGGYFWGRSTREPHIPSLVMGSTPSGLQPALREAREKIAEAGELLRSARRDSAGRMQAALTLRNLLEQHATVAAGPAPKATTPPWVRFSQYAEKAATRAQNERLGLLRLSRVLLEVSLALHRAQSLTRMRGTTPPPMGTTGKKIRRPRQRATRELLSYLEHRYGPQADRN